MTDERIGDLQHQEVEKIIRAALRLGESVAQRRAANLARAARMSQENTERLRRTLNVEHDAAQPLYRRALDPRFWDDPSTRVDDVREVVQAARAFAPWDPEAALAARECDKHAGILDAQGRPRTPRRSTRANASTKPRRRLRPITCRCQGQIRTVLRRPAV